MDGTQSSQKFIYNYQSLMGLSNANLGLKHKIIRTKVITTLDILNVADWLK